MRARFQADADLMGVSFEDLRRAAPEIDIRTAVDAELDGVKDPDLLRIVADSGLILVSRDRRTMPGHFARYKGRFLLFPSWRRVILCARV